MADILGFPYGPRPGDVSATSGLPCDVEPPCEGNGDLVRRPPHYIQGNVEAIDIIEHVVAGYPNPVISGLIWNVLKYLIRAPYKNPTIAEDLKKAQWYLNRAVNKLG